MINSNTLNLPTICDHETVSPKKYIEIMSGLESENIKRAVFQPPQIGSRDFGKFVVHYKTSKLVLNRAK